MIELRKLLRLFSWYYSLLSCVSVAGRVVELPGTRTGIFQEPIEDGEMSGLCLLGIAYAALCY